MGATDSVCRIIGSAIMMLAFGATLVSVSTLWISSHVKTEVADADLADEHTYVSLWRYEMTQDPGKDRSETWRDYISRNGRDTEYCPNDKGTSYGDIYTKIQAAEACVCMAVVFGLIAVVSSVVHACGALPNRGGIIVPSIFMILSGIGAIIAWMSFYNSCDDNFCQRYVNQDKATEGRCHLDVGFAFMCTAVALAVIGMIPLVAVAPRSGEYKFLVFRRDSS